MYTALAQALIFEQVTSSIMQFISSISYSEVHFLIFMEKNFALWETLAINFRLLNIFLSHQ
jgi:hypothetical protein